MPKLPRGRPSNPPGPRFSFRWGIPILDNLPFTVLYHFLLDHYAELGIDPLEMMFIVHLSQFRHESPEGHAAPGLPTIARLMGYKDEQQARRIKQRLVDKGMLRVTARAGLPDIYDVAPFAAAAFQLWEAEQRSAAATPIQNDSGIILDRGITDDTPTPIILDRGPLSHAIGEKERNQRTKEDGSNQEENRQRGPVYSPLIAGTILDLGTTLKDKAAPQAATEALLLWQRSGLSEAAFVDALLAARGPHRRIAAVLQALAAQLGV